MSMLMSRVLVKHQVHKKSFWKSKTVWVALAWAALTAFTPLIETYMKSHTTFFSCGMAFIFIFLRLITKEGVNLKLNNKGHGDYGALLWIAIIAIIVILVTIVGGSFLGFYISKGFFILPGIGLFFAGWIVKEYFD